MRILAIGDTEALAETRRILSRSEYEMYRVPAALAAVRMVRQIPFDLMIVVHPLVDTDFGGFHREVRARSSPCRDCQLLVLAPSTRLGDLVPFRHDARLQAVDADQPQHRLAEAAARHLGPIRTATRYDLELPVAWQGAARPSRTKDISASGALIAHAGGRQPAIGDRFAVELGLPDGPVTLPAEVVRYAGPTDDPVHGFAVTWVRPDEGELERLETLLAAPS